MKRECQLALGLLFFSLVCHFALLWARQTAPVVSGDEGTFLAMIESLALDGDLLFDRPDLERLEAAPERGRKAVILQEFGERIAYSKPVLYAILAAPWYRVGGVAGVIALNVVAAAAALVLAWLALARFGATRPALTVVTFAGTSVFLGYLAWTMSDSLQASLTLAGMTLGIAGLRAPGARGAYCARWSGIFDRSWSPYLGVVLLAMVASMRLPNLVLAGAPILAWLLRRRFRRALALAGVVALIAAGGYALNKQLAGAAVPYKTVRATFNPQSGYPVGAEAERARDQFSDKVALATLRVSTLPVWQPEVSAYSAFYFFVGRHTGLLWYFPAAIVLLAAGLRRPDAVTWAVLLPVVALAGFYWVWMPENYFGGASFLGNRYFLTGYTALLLLPRREPSRVGLAAAWIIGVLVFSSALGSVLQTRRLDGSSQSHAHAGIFRMLPYETTARAIDGRRDVYWTNEFFRFVDPFAVVDPRGFSLRAGDAPAEVLHVNRRRSGVVRFLARSDSPKGRIRYQGSSGERTLELTPAESGAWGLLEVELQPAKRRHPYWFLPNERPHSRSHWFQFEGADQELGIERSAELHYLGSMRLVPKFFRGVTMAVETPESGRAGDTVRIPIRVRNTGFRFWSSTEAVPTRLGYRIYSLPRNEGDQPVGGRLQEFEGRVPRGSELETELRVRWPKKPGNYELVIDLNLGGAVWYGAWNQRSLAEAMIEVQPNRPATPAATNGHAPSPW